jgi:cytochrome P450
MLSRYPAVYDKVLEELQRELPRLFDPSDDYVPSMEDAASLTYLEAVIKESLRLNPAAPLTSRVAIEDTVLSDGTFVPKGVRVVFPTYAAARMPWLWGEDAAAFRPDRWIDETTGKLRQVSPFKFLVFHGGPRICLGVKLAMLEMKIALAAMLSQFEFVLDKDPFEITYDMSLSLPIRGELLASVHPVRAVGTVPPAVVA